MPSLILLRIPLLLFLFASFSFLFHLFTLPVVFVFRPRYLECLVSAFLVPYRYCTIPQSPMFALLCCSVSK